MKVRQYKPIWVFLVSCFHQTDTQFHNFPFIFPSFIQVLSNSRKNAH